MNSQMFKLVLEKAEEPEIKLRTSTESSKKNKKVPEKLQEMRIPEHLTCLLRNLYAGQEATVRTGHGTTDWFQIKAVYCHPAYLTYMQSTSFEMPVWMKHNPES